MLTHKIKEAYDIFSKEGVRKLFMEMARLVKENMRYFYMVKIYDWKYGSSAARPDKILWINPHKINYKLVPFFNNSVPNKDQTYYFGGDWDINKGKPDQIYPEEYNGIPSERTLIQIKDLDWYRSFNSHFNNGKPWEETRVYRRRVKEGYNTSRYDSEEGLKQRLSKIDQLYENIVSEGYKTQAELIQEKNSPLEARDWTHEVQVNIGRAGEFILDDNRNRLILAQIADVSKIPVRVLVRHKQWQQIRDNIYKRGLSEEQEQLRDHPDLQDVLN